MCIVYCLDSTQSLSSLGSSVVEQYVVGSSPTGAAFLFSIENEMFRSVVLPCFNLCRSNSFHVIR